jgi:hypothetical protein
VDTWTREIPQDVPVTAPNATLTDEPAEPAHQAAANQLAALAEITGNLNRYIQRTAEQIAEPRIAAAQAEVDQRVAAIEASLGVQLERAQDVIVELRRQMDPLIRQSDAWSRLLLLCRQADNAQAAKSGIPGSVGALGTGDIRRCLETAPTAEEADRG